MQANNLKRVSIVRKILHYRVNVFLDKCAPKVVCHTRIRVNWQQS